MKKLILPLMAASVSSFASTYVEHVNAVKGARPQDEARINHVAVLSEDLVIHYENAVVNGTTADYIELTKIQHFNSFLDASDEKCSEVDLTSCIYDLICMGEVTHNLNTDIFTCN